MIRNTLIKHCAPTLAGIKTGNIFSVKRDHYDINEEIRKLNSIFVNKGLRLVPIRKKDDTVLIYLYRPECLQRDLKNPVAREILKEKGYPCENCESCLVELVKHLEKDTDFPHEIGLFLGYPPYDVKKFMESPCKGVKCVGCWKAYGNESKARETFEKYKKCTEIYSRESESGRPLEALIVDIHSNGYEDLVG